MLKTLTPHNYCFYYADELRHEGFAPEQVERTLNASIFRIEQNELILHADELDYDELAETITEWSNKIKSMENDPAMYASFHARLCVWFQAIE